MSHFGTTWNLSCKFVDSDAPVYFVRHFSDEWGKARRGLGTPAQGQHTFAGRVAVCVAGREVGGVYN